eukprot:1157982-Pelagomonas_calceolata.AAC.5
MATYFISMHDQTAGRKGLPARDEVGSPSDLQSMCKQANSQLQNLHFNKREPLLLLCRRLGAGGCTGANSDMQLYPPPCGRPLPHLPV